MNKPISIALFVIGVILLGFALYSGDSVSSGFSRIFKGTPDNRTIVLVVLGVLAFVAGGISLSRSSRV